MPITRKFYVHDGDHFRPATDREIVEYAMGIDLTTGDVGDIPAESVFGDRGWLARQLIRTAEDAQD